MKLEDAVGIGLTFIGEEHIFTFMLSSPFTARNLVREKGDVTEVKKDLQISIGISIALSLVMAYLFQSTWVAVAGFAFGCMLYWIYAKRGELRE
jgi:Flp pilus assembly protein TadB